MTGSNKVFFELQSKYFVHVTRFEETLTAMTFIRDEAAEAYIAEHGRMSAERAADIASWDAMSEEARALLPRPPAIQGLDPREAPLTAEAAVRALSPQTRDEHDPGLLFTAASIGNAGQGLWRCTQWDTYYHGSDRYSAAERSGSQDWVLTADGKGFVFAPYNRRLQAALTRDRGPTDLARIERSVLVSVRVPYEGAPLDQCIVLVNANRDIGYWTNLSNVQETDLSVLDGGAGGAFGVVVELAAPTAVAADAKCDLTVTVTIGGVPATGRTIAVNLDASSGYLAARRVLVENGQAVVGFRAMDLPVGTRALISAGIDHAPQPATRTIEIV